jgi:sugar/nucleoside kinase (ribokinase family)
MTAQPILLVGSVALDDIETPFGSVRDAYGGSATYFALAARFFAPLRLVAVVGTDFPDEHRALLQEANVDMRGLEVAEGKCFRWGGKYDFDLNSRETLFTHLNVFEHFHPKVPAEYQDTPVRLPRQHSSRAAVRGAPAGARAAPGGARHDEPVDRNRPRAALKVLRSVDLLILNDGEARQLAGEPNLVRAGRRLLELGRGTS